MNIKTIALAYAHSGLSVIPTLADKRPACAWKQFTQRIMSDREIETFFGGDQNPSTLNSKPSTLNSRRGIGIVCGNVSGNLELLDFDDGGSAFEPWFAKVPPYLRERLVVETSPSGGKHVYYRVGGGEGSRRPTPQTSQTSHLLTLSPSHPQTSQTPQTSHLLTLTPSHPLTPQTPQTPQTFSYAVVGNRKLAMKADGHVLIETRGEGGYVKCAPSEGYVLVQGDFEHIQNVTPFEEQILIEYAQKMDECNPVAGCSLLVDGSIGNTVGSRVPRDRENGEMVGGDSQAPRGGFIETALPGNASADLEVRAPTNKPINQQTNQPFNSQLSTFNSQLFEPDIRPVLERHGWKRVGGSRENENWERPGKNERATSATFNGEVFYVFSSNAAPFEPNRGYNRFQVYALLEHGGNTKAAAFALRIANGALGDRPLPDAVGSRVPRDRGNGEMVGGDSQAPRGGFIETALPEPETRNPELADPSGPPDPGPLPAELLHVPGFVDALTAHTLATAPYPNRPLAFAGALTMLAHLSGRNYRDPRNLRTNVYLLALADSGVGKDYPRKVNMNLAAEVGIMPTMADRFASAEGLEDALLIHPTSFFQVDEVDTLFAALQEKKDSSIEKIYGALLQFATSSDTTYAMRKKAIQQTGGKAGKFDKIRARGIREPHLTLLGCAIPKYLYSALSERAMENGLLSRCLIIEAGERGRAGNPHAEPFSEEILAMARSLVEHGGFDGLDLENLDDALGGEGSRRPTTFAAFDGGVGTHRPTAFAAFDGGEGSRRPTTFAAFDGGVGTHRPTGSTTVGRADPCPPWTTINQQPTTINYPEPFTVSETPEALERHNEVVALCERLYDEAKTTAEKALWTRGAEKAARLALMYAISENVYDPLITPAAVEWGWRIVEHLTRRMLYQASVYVHDNEFDALRQKALRYLRDYGANGSLNHGALLRYLHIDSDTMRRVVETLVQSELITVLPLSRGGFRYTLVQSSHNVHNDL